MSEDMKPESLDPVTDWVPEEASMHEKEGPVRAPMNEPHIPPQEKHEFDSLEQENTYLRKQTEWILTSNQDLSERLVVTRAENRSLKTRAVTAEAEVERLREVNARLHAELETTEAMLSSAKRRHRIVVESLMSDGSLCRIGEILVAAGLISNSDLEEALREQDAVQDRLLGSILVEEGRAREEDVAQAVACQFSLPLLAIEDEYLDPDLPGKVGEEICRSHTCLPMQTRNSRILVAMTNPADSDARQSIMRATGCRVVPFISTPSEIRQALDEVFGKTEEAAC